ncbi:MAG: hypothetical protein ACQESP_08535 [Candidatus Muiribacteriota bacterium]
MNFKKYLEKYTTAEALKLYFCDILENKFINNPDDSILKLRLAVLLRESGRYKKSLEYLSIPAECNNELEKSFLREKIITLKEMKEYKKAYELAQNKNYEDKEMMNFLRDMI